MKWREYTRICRCNATLCVCVCVKIAKCESVESTGWRMCVRVCARQKRNGRDAKCFETLAIKLDDDGTILKSKIVNKNWVTICRCESNAVYDHFCYCTQSYIYVHIFNLKPNAQAHWFRQQLRAPWMSPSSSMRFYKAAFTRLNEMCDEESTKFASYASPSHDGPVCECVANSPLRAYGRTIAQTDGN